MTLGAHAVIANATIATLSVNGVYVSGGTTAAEYSWDGSEFSVTSSQSLTGGQPIVSWPSGTIASISNLGTISSINTSNGSAIGIINEGRIDLIDNQGYISGLSGAIYNSGTMGTIHNTGTITASTTAIDNWGGTFQAIDNDGGTISGAKAIANEGSALTIGQITNSGLITGSTSGIRNSGTINSIVNSVGGDIESSTGQAILNNGTLSSIGTLSNAGTISGEYAVLNDGLIGTLTNSGTLSAGDYAVDNYGTISALLNTTGGVATDSLVAIKNETGSSIGSLVNSGTLAGIDDAVVNVGNIGAINNTGSMSSGNDGIANYGSIGSLVNGATGTITGGYAAVYNGTGATITSLSNAGTLSAASGTAVENKGTIGTLTNTGIITASGNAIENGGSIGAIVNSGVIAGNINNILSSSLTIDGGTGTTFGTLTGYNGASGTITSTAADLTFGSGNLLLNDTINVGSNTVYNRGATLEVDGITSITGNYSQGQAATLLIGVASGATATGSLSDTGYGRLIVSGNAAIDAGSTVTLKSTTGGYAFAVGQRYVVVDAAGTGTYNASQLNYSIAGSAASLSGASVTTSAGHTDLVVTVDSLTGTTTGGSDTGSTGGTGSTSSNPITPTTPIARSALGGLNAYSGVSDARLLNLYDAAIALQTYGSVGDVNRAGAQLAPISQASTARAAAAPTYDVLDIVSNHLGGLRLAQNEGATGVSTGEGALSNGIWGQAFGGHASQDARDSVDGYSANFAGLMFGLDRALGDAWRVGGVFSYTNSAINNTGDTAGDTTRVNSYGLIGYGSYAASRWYANLSAGAVLQRYDTNRQVNFSGFSGEAGASFGGMQYVVRGELGMPLAVGRYTVTPLAALTYSYLHQNGYAEGGGNGAALSVGATHSTSVKSDFGTKLSRDFETSYGVVVPELTLAWRHEYDHTRSSSAASYVGDPSGETSFTTLGSSPVSDLADVALGVTLMRSSNLSLNIRYELEAGKGYVAQAGSVKLRQLF